VAGTRIPVYCVLELVQAGISFDEIISAYYPDLTFEDVAACVEYATELVKSVGGEMMIKTKSTPAVSAQAEDYAQEAMAILAGYAGALDEVHRLMALPAEDPLVVMSSE